MDDMAVQNDASDPMLLQKALEAAQYTPSTASAMDRVFSTYELVQAIILLLPPEDVLLAANFSTTWCDVVESSQPIKAHLISSLKFTVHETAEGHLFSPPLSHALFLFYYIDYFGTLIVRGVGDYETLAVLHPEKKGAHKLLVPNGKDVIIKFERRSKRSWWVKVENLVARWSCVGKVVQYTRSIPAIYTYLRRFHSVERALIEEV